MFRRLGLAFVALALFTTAGGHWAVLQSVAWAQMIRDYSREVPLTAAVQKTFSGEAPCSLCKSIVAARQKEDRKPAAFKAELKTELFSPPARTALRLPAPDPFRYPAPVLAAFPVRSDAPPQPIPIARA